MAQVLADPRYDQLLERDGFVVLPSRADVDIKALSTAYEDLGRPIQGGFVADLMVADPDYRRRADATIEKYTDRSVRSRFTDYEPFMYSFLCKYPGPDSDLYLHQDWMYVDERKGNETFVAWMALVDVTGHSGQLRAVRGSHRMESSLRGTMATLPWLDHVDVIEKELVSIPAKKGDIVVMNNALIHSSFPNNTDVPRLIAATGMKRRGVPLAYFRRVDDHRVARYDVDRTFFQNYAPVNLIQAPPDLPVAEIIDEPIDHRTSKQLEADLVALRYYGFSPFQRICRRFSRR